MQIHVNELCGEIVGVAVPLCNPAICTIINKTTITILSSLQVNMILEPMSFIFDK